MGYLIVRIAELAGSAKSGATRQALDLMPWRAEGAVAQCGLWAAPGPPGAPPTPVPLLHDRQPHKGQAKRQQVVDQVHQRRRPQ